MLVERYKQAWAKTANGGQTLYEHTFQCVAAAMRLAQFAPNYPTSTLDVLMLSLCAHDIGKLDPTFQKMLQAKLTGQTYKGRFAKHEAHSLEHDHISLLENGLDEFATELKANFGYRINIDQVLLDGGVEWIWAAAVNHHGLFYLSYEKDDTGRLQPLARRQWTSFSS